MKIVDVFWYCKSEVLPRSEHRKAIKLICVVGRMEDLEKTVSTITITTTTIIKIFTEHQYPLSSQVLITRATK